MQTKRTVFSTPVVTPCFRALANRLLKLSGWKFVAKDLPAPPYVVVAAPHTSNWDLPLMLTCVFHAELNINWMGKDSLFPKPLAPAVKWFGGIPIDRRATHGIVNQIVQQFSEDPRLVVMIPPEGTRQKPSRWKTGFYHIAHEAKVPILIAAIDAEKRELRFAGMYQPTGDIEKELPEIQQLVAGVRGIIPGDAWDISE